MSTKVQNKYQVAILVEEENYGLSGITTTIPVDTKAEVEEKLLSLVHKALNDGAGGEPMELTPLCCSVRRPGKTMTYFLQVIYPIGKSETEEMSEELTDKLSDQGFEFEE